MTPLKTVLITGASHGIGYALAKRFASENYRIVAIARDKARLETLAAECQQQYQVPVIPISQDLSEPNAVATIIGQLSSLKIEIDVLVNNAGFGLWGNYTELALADSLAMVEVHINALLKLTYLLLPAMIAKGQGKILNMGSVYCFTPIPYQAVYSATKAFMYAFSAALQAELKGKNINITLVCPGSTDTYFRKRATINHKTNSNFMTAEQVADISYKALEANKKVVITGFYNKLYILLTKLLPLSAIEWITYKFNGVKIAR